MNKYIYGLSINIKDFIAREYSGKDIPSWMDTSENNNPLMKKINNPLLVGNALGGVSGYLLSIIKL